MHKNETFIFSTTIPLLRLKRVKTLFTSVDIVIRYVNFNDPQKFYEKIFFLLQAETFLNKTFTELSLAHIGWCAHYDCDALWIQNFQDGGEGREISQVVRFVFQ